MHDSPGGAFDIKRLVHLSSFALSRLPVMLAQVIWRPNAVLVIAPALFCAPQAGLVARLCGGKAWLHFRDFETDAAFELGLLRGQRLRRVLAAGARRLMRRFDMVSTISERMLTLRGRFVSPRLRAPI